jgi:hypothetical protein
MTFTVYINHNLVYLKFDIVNLLFYTDEDISCHGA